MNLLPRASGNRPRLACEIAATGVVAGRSPEAGAPLTAVAQASLSEGAVVPSLHPGNIVDRVAVIAAVRRALEQVGGRANARDANLTLIVPDGAVRVLLLDFDALPNKLSEALPIVRFRLKKLVPFDTDHAMVSFQIMSTTRTMIRVLAVSVPRDVLTEYESVAREAGFEPGAVLPSTLAALACLDEGEGASLLVNAHGTGITTAIVRAGMLLLHRSVDLGESVPVTPVNVAAAGFEPTPAQVGIGRALPLVDREASAAEWAAQEALPEYGRNPYADRISAEAAVEEQDSITGMEEPATLADDDNLLLRRMQAYRGASSDGFLHGEEPAPVSHSPYAGPNLLSDLQAEVHHALLDVPAFPESSTGSARAEEVHRFAAVGLDEGPEPLVHTLAPDAQADEIARAISVAVAYFEDSLGAVPGALLSAGSLGAEDLERMLREQGIAQEEGLRVRELVDPAMVASSFPARTGTRGSFAGVVGALRS